MESFGEQFFSKKSLKIKGRRLIVFSSSVCIKSEPAYPFVDDGKYKVFFNLCVTLEGGAV